MFVKMKTWRFEIKIYKALYPTLLGKLMCERFKKKKCENHHTSMNIHIESSRIKIQDLRKRT